MSTIVAATVSINMALETAGFTTGMDRATKSAASWGRELERQIGVLEMGADQYRLYELALRGVDVGIRDTLRALLDKKKAMEDAAEAERQAARQADALAAAQQRENDAAASYARQLESQIRATTMGADAARLYELQQKGVDATILHTVATLQTQRKALDDAAAAERNTAKAAEEMARAQQRAHDVMTANGQSVFDATRTGAERYQAKLAELGGLLKAGAIDHDTYGRAVKAAQTEMVQGAMSGASLSGVLATLGPVGIAAGVGLAAVAAAAAAVGAAAYKAVGFLIDLTQEGFRNVNALSEQAANIGTSTRMLAGLQLAAEHNGSSAEQLNTSLAKLVQTMGDAVRVGGPAADAFGALGVDVVKLANEDPSRAFIDVVTALNAIKNPAERASLAVDIFGKSAQQMNGLISGGAAAIQEGFDSAAKFGTLLSDVDAKQVNMVVDAVKDLGRILQGVGEQLAVRVSPYVYAAAEGIKKFVLAAGPISSQVGDALRNVGDYLGRVVDGVQVFAVAFETAFRPAIALAEALASKLGGIKNVLMFFANNATPLGFVNDLAKLGDANRQLATSNGGSTWSAQLADGIHAVAAEYKNAAQAAVDFGKQNQISASAVIAKQLQKQADETAKAVASVFDGLENKVNTDPFQQAINKLKEMKMYTEENRAKLEALFYEMAEKDATKQREKDLENLKEAAKKIAEDAQTPFEKMQEQIAKVQEAARAGLIDNDTANRAIEKAQAEFDKLSEAKKASEAGGGGDRQTAARQIRFLASIPGFNSMSKDEGWKELTNIGQKQVTSLDEINSTLQERLTGYTVAEIAL